MGDLEFEHHDGNDDGNDSVGEGFKAGWGGDVMGHSGLLSESFVLAEAYNAIVAVRASC